MKEAYLDTASMDDGQLLMQFFKKRDIDNNMKLDGLELLAALVEMEGNELGAVLKQIYFKSLQKMKIITMVSMAKIKIPRILSIEKTMPA